MGQMLTAVACETGQPVRVLLDEPLWSLLYTFHHLEERAARRALHDRLTRVDLAILNSRAFNAPETLADEMTAVRGEIEAFERGPVDEVSELRSLKARGLALAARMDAGRVLAPEALVTE